MPPLSDPERQRRPRPPRHRADYGSGGDEYKGTLPARRPRGRASSRPTPQLDVRQAVQPVDEALPDTSEDDTRLSNEAEPNDDEAVA